VTKNEVGAWKVMIPLRGGTALQVGPVRFGFFADDRTLYQPTGCKPFTINDISLSAQDLHRGHFSGLARKTNSGIEPVAKAHTFGGVLC
jgi:hypothetical protein